MCLFKPAAALLTAAMILGATGCGARAGGSAMSILPQPPASIAETIPGPAPASTFQPSAFMADTSDGIHALQVFDEAHGYLITEAQGIADGHRYASVWGVRNKIMAWAWHSSNQSLGALIYTPYDTDATGSGLNQTTKWWLTNHPDWVLYECDKTTIAFVPGLPGVPLDISNPDVRKYQVGLLGAYAEANRYDGVAADIVSLNNNTGHARSGGGGCGVWTNAHTTWVSKFSGAFLDPKWAAATRDWVWDVRRKLHDPALFSRKLALAINSNVDVYPAPVNRVGGDPDEKALVSSADILLNEAGFSMWGSYLGDKGFNNAVGWMEFAQARGEAVLTTDDWNQQSQSPTVAQLGYSIATYLMGKEQAAALYVGQNAMYGKENYYSEYDAKIGRACGPMYGGPNDPVVRGKNVYFRKYSGGFAVVNVNSKLPYTVALPKASYRDIEGKTVVSPMTIQPNSGAVLLTSNGCG